MKYSPYWVAESIRDLRDWVIVYEEPWKEGVIRLHCRRSLDAGKMEFRQIYRATDILHPITELEVVQ